MKTNNELILELKREMQVVEIELISISVYLMMAGVPLVVGTGISLVNLFLI